MSEPENTLEEIAGLAKEEMVRRLRKEPDSIPTHVLGRLAMDAHRAIERQEREAGPEPEPFSVLEETLALPTRRAGELLEQEIRRQQAETKEYIRAHQATVRKLRREPKNNGS